MAVTASSYPFARPCPACGREWGAGIACQFCDQVEGLPSGVRLSSPARRFGGYLLEGLLAAVTLGLGWLVWSLIVDGRGQTPAKQLLSMRVVELRTGARASWGRMLLREFVAKPLMGLLAGFTVGIAYFWLVWDGRNQELWDKVVGTIVVNDPDKQLVSELGAATVERARPIARSQLDQLPFPRRSADPVSTVEEPERRLRPPVSGDDEPVGP